jgi:PKD repeat protein
VQISSTDGCLDESSPEIITVNPLPIVNLFALSSSVFCDGDSVILQSNTGTGYSYEWYKNSSILPLDTLYQKTAFTTGSYSVKITNSNNCSALSATASVISNTIPTSDFNMVSTLCSSDTATISFNGSASSGAFYNWNFDGGTVLSGTGQGPYQVIWNTAGLKYPSLSVSDNSCVSAITNDTIDIKSVISNITAPTTSVCQGDSVMLYANAGQNLSYTWLQGGLIMPSVNNSSLVVLQTGNYQVEVTDTIIGCSQLSSPIAVNINPTDFNLAFSANTTTFSQPPFNVSFTNQTPNMSSYQFDWDLGDGSTSNFYNPGHSYQYNGTYTVNLYAENANTGCRDTLSKIDYISCNGGAPNPCNIVAAITPAGPITICNGDSILLTASSGTGYTYQWAYNSMIIPNADSVIFYAKQAGIYRVIITDAVCSQTSPAFVLNHYPSIVPVIQATGIIQPCTTDSLNLSLLVNYNSYNWSTGDTIPSIYVSQTGYYQVAVTDNYGCNMTSAPYVVSNSYLNPPELCLVGVDSANHNRLIWERQNNALIDSFYIYKESFIAGQYNQIGAIPFTQTSLFVDVNSNPAIQAYKYKIAAVDTCGGLTLLGNFHKTIHLTINAGLNGSWNLIWDGYQGFQFNTYRIYRGTNTNNMALLTQLPSSATSYTDLNPPSGTVYYQIEVLKNTGCYPDTTFAKANTNYNSSRSNTANNGNITPVYLNSDFTANVLTGIWPVQVQFTDNSTGSPDTWHWNFGDGNTSIEQNPVHTYNNTGLYTVELMVCNGNICDTVVKTDYIEVLPNGMVEIGVELAAKLFPNPNDGNFTIEIADKGQHNLQLHMYNALGSEVYFEEFQSNGNTRKNLKFNSLPSGVYFVHLNTNKKIVYRTKVVIRR